MFSKKFIHQTSKANRLLSSNNAIFLQQQQFNKNKLLGFQLINNQQLFNSDYIQSDKHSYKKGGEFEPVDCTVGYHLSKVARKQPFANFLSVPHQKISWSFKNLKKQIEGFACGLLDSGVRPGDRVGIIQGNNTESIVALFAANKIGASLVPLPPVKNEKDFNRQLELIRPRVIIMQSKVGKTNYLNLLSNEIFPELKRRGELEDFVVPFKSKKYPFVKQIILTDYKEHSIPGMEFFRELFLFGPFGYYENPLRRVALSIDNKTASVILPDNISANDAKYYVYSHENLLNASKVICEKTGIKEGDKTLITQDVSSLSGILGIFASFYSASNVLIPSIQWNPSEALKQIEAEKATVLFTSGDDLTELLEDRSFSKYKYDSLRSIVVDETASDALINKAKSQFNVEKVSKISGTYDTTGVITVDDELAPGTEIKITREDGKIVHKETSGDLKIRSPFVAKGFWNDVGEMNPDIDEDGWIQTGKMATINKDNNLTIH